MTERAYTVSEIDALKVAHENKFLWGFYSGAKMPPPDRAGYSMLCGRTAKQEELLAAIESGVRLSMLAGHTAKDLLSSEASTEGERCEHCNLPNPPSNPYCFCTAPTEGE
jgi:hypothetical protein